MYLSSLVNFFYKKCIKTVLCIIILNIECTIGACGIHIKFRILFYKKRRTNIKHQCYCFHKKEMKQCCYWYGYRLLYDWFYTVCILNTKHISCNNDVFWWTKILSLFHPIHFIIMEFGLLFPLSPWKITFIHQSE